MTIDEPIDDLFVSLKIPNLDVRTSLYRGSMAQLLGRDYALDSRGPRESEHVT